MSVEKSDDSNENKRENKLGCNTADADEPPSTASTCSSEKTKKKRGRHGARNENRHKNFVKWIMKTFPQLSNYTNASYSHVLDVAGGKGETAARLVFCHRQNVIMVDPRPCDIASCFEFQVLPKLPKKWQQRIHAQQEANSNFVQDIVDSRFRQLVTTFDESTVATSTELQEAIKNASIIIGMHADSATEAIVDAALQNKRPFVTIPCCVFPRLFSQRTIQGPDGTTVKVRSHEQFCQYLLEKDHRCVQEVLPFEGRNVAIWWDGLEDSSDETR